MRSVATRAAIATIIRTRQSWQMARLTKIVKKAGLVLAGIGLVALIGNFILWAVLRGEFAVTGESTRWIWYAWEFPYYHVIGLGTFVAALGATLALLGDRHVN
jgi:hypothetical protein